MTVRILINPNAGKMKLDAIQSLHGVYRAFSEGGYQVTMELTLCSVHAEETLNRVFRDKPDILVCCGGDGTLSTTADRLLRSEVKLPLGYIPSGTTNDFASFLGLPKEPPEAAELIVNGVSTPIDVGRFEDRHFIYVASFGAFTQTSYSTTQSLKNSLGHLAYVLEGIKELPAIQSYSVRVETVEGSVFEGEYLFGAVSNSTSLGGVIKLDPAKVDPTDGKFELTLVKKPKSLHELNRILPALMGGKADEELITFVHTAGASFSCPMPMPWSLDGEYVSGGTNVKISVLSGHLELFR